MYKLTLDFLGKDSVRYQNSFEVPDEIGEALEELLVGKGPKDKIFDKANSGTVNAFLQECIPYCTAKLFRTTYGTKLLAEELQKMNIKKGTPEWKIRSMYDKACLVVSTKLNHQRNVAKNFTAQLEKTDDNITKAKDATKKRKEKATEQLRKIKKEMETAKKCFEGEKLKEKLLKIKEKKDRIAAQVERSQERIEKLEDKKEFKKDSKNIALGTAKGAYSSPRIVYSFCKDLGVDVGIVYNKTLQNKFAWAANTPASYWRTYPN